MVLHQPAYLTGFMGSGKSTVGPRLAAALDVPFVDLDEMIVSNAAKPIPQIFDEDGEEAFRTLEREALRRTASMDACVVAVGGGALASDAGLGIAQKAGVVVYLQVEVQDLVRRLKRRQGDRPMLHDSAGNVLPDRALEARVRRLLTAREVYYEKADVIIRTRGRTVLEVVEEIADRLRRL